MSEMALYSKFEIVEDDELSSLGSPLWMEMDLERIIDWMVSETVFTRRDPVTGKSRLNEQKLQNLKCSVYRIRKVDDFDSNDISTISINIERIK